MILTDVNVLVYAFRSDAEQHADYKAWLESIVNGQAAYALSPQVLGAVVRVCTDPRIFAKPSARRDVFEFCRMLVEQPTATVILPGQHHWSIFENLCDRSRASGNMVQDAWFAALAIESGCEWISCDRDFARFPGLNWRPPF